MSNMKIKTTDDLLRDGKQPIDAECVLISEAIQTNDLDFIKLLLQKKNIFSDNEVHNCWLLHEAIDSKNVEIVSTLLQHGVCLESCPSVKSFNTALQAAVTKGHIPVIEELLRYNADWTETNREGQTVLHLPFISDQMHNYYGCKSGVERAEMKATSGRTIIQIIELFLNVGIDINVRNIKNHTPLFLAASHRMVSVCKYLLERGAKILNDELFFHNLILDEIESFRREEVIELRNETLVKCVVRENVEFLNWLLSKGFNVNATDPKGKTPLQLALEHNMMHILPTLLKYATKLKLQDKRGKTVLHIFLETNFRNKPTAKEKFFALSNQYEDIERIVKIMVSKGVSVDAVDKTGKTPCHLVAQKGRKKLLKFMVEHSNSSVVAEALFPGVSSWIQDDDPRQEENEEIILIWVAKGLIIRRDSGWNMRLILLAIKYKLQKTFDALLAFGFNAKICTDQKENLLHLAIKEDTSFKNGLKLKDIVKFLIEWGCDANGRTKEGRTPLHEAASSGSAEVIKILFEHNVDVNARDNLFHHTPLHMAIKNKKKFETVVNTGDILFHYFTNFRAAVKNKKNFVTIVQMLIEKGADVNARQRAGKTPLHLAIIHGFTDIVERLLSAGADVDAEDCKGRGLLHAALEHRDKVALKLLLEHAVDISDLNTILTTSLNYLDDHDHVWESLFKHFIKLQYIGLSYPEVRQANMTSQDEIFESLMYSAEVKKIKNFVIEGSVTLYDFLHMNPIDRLAYTKGEKFNDFACWVENEFTFYRSVIKASYREAIARKPLLEPAKRAWLELTKIYLPDICVERIIYFSSNKTLKIMIGSVETNARKRPAELSAGNSAKKFNGASSEKEIWLD